MTITIYKNGPVYTVHCPGQVTLSGTDLEALKVKAKHHFRLFTTPVEFKIVGH